ncbi:hypothetical protein QVD17_35382 [Tagetes erecta]|uniref:Uncharacterized protein n=1 Tax=Tagetes erecta TaxID=13708 RepID=A0AAD8K3D6_TARER|nr:hypothetical protein QVD17_35382 [Tagetes erecta]
MRGSIIQQMFRVVGENHSPAALNLGCVIVRSSRSQRNNNPRSYLSPRNQDYGPNIPNAANQTHTFSEINNDIRPVFNVTPPSSSFYPQTMPRQMISFDNRPPTIYSLYHGFHFHPPVPQMGFQSPNPKPNPDPNNIITRTPVFQTNHVSLPSSSQTGCPQRLFCFNKDENGSKKESRPELVECDLSLRLGLVSGNEKGLAVVDDVDLRPGLGPCQRSKEFSFFPLNSEAAEVGSSVTELMKRKTVGESQSFLHLERGFDEINEQIKRREFVTERSKDSHTLFQKELEKNYGPKNYENPDRDDEAVWKRMHPDSGRRLFGVGSSDSSFVLNGRYPSFYGCSSYGDARQTQEVQSVRLELEKERAARENLENRLEQLEKNREEEREQARVEKEKERAEREKLQKRMDDILKRIG